MNKADLWARKPLAEHHHDPNPLGGDVVTFEGQAEENCRKDKQDWLKRRQRIGDANLA